MALNVTASMARWPSPRPRRCRVRTTPLRSTLVVSRGTSPPRQRGAQCSGNARAPQAARFSARGRAPVELGVTCGRTRQAVVVQHTFAHGRERRALRAVVEQVLQRVSAPRSARNHAPPRRRHVRASPIGRDTGKATRHASRAHEAESLGATTLPAGSKPRTNRGEVIAMTERSAHASATPCRRAIGEGHVRRRIMSLPTRTKRAG